MALIWKSVVSDVTGANGRAPHREAPWERNVIGGVDDSTGYIRAEYFFRNCGDVGIECGVIVHGGTGEPVGW
jgi:hypothetical protein